MNSTESNNSIISSSKTSESSKSAICLVYCSPIAHSKESVSIRVSDMIKTFDPSVSEIFLITRKDVFQGLPHRDTVHFIAHLACRTPADPLLIFFLGELKAQIQIARGILFLKKEVKNVFWRGRSSTIVFPLLLSKLKRKKSILFIESHGSDLVSDVYHGPLRLIGIALSYIYQLIEKLVYKLADELVVNVPGLLQQEWIKKHKEKAYPLPASIRSIDPSFTVSTPLSDRGIVVGYVGRMSTEKGILNMIKASRFACEQISNVEFLYVGDGPLFEQIKNEIKALDVEKQSRLCGWITYDKLPEYLNEMKLLVLPSDYEGLPNIILEAMACGTIVLATPVGAVPDLITDGETGFIMNNNSPECIGENITRALNYPDLEQVSRNGQEMVKNNYRYTVIKDRYSEIIARINL